MFIDKNSPIPVYFQIKNYILEKVRAEEWPKDNAIPSERELGEQAKVSRMTVRQAINELVNEGVLYRLKGKGTFIARAKIEQRNIMSFSDMVKSKGITPVTEILAFESQLLCPQVAQEIELDENTRFYRIKRLRKADEVPIGIEEVFIPEEYCGQLEKYDMTGSLYKVLLEEYHYKIERVNLNIEAVMANEEERELLQMSKSMPLLKASGNSITNTGMSLFYEISYYRSDKLSYKVSIFNRQDY